MGDRYLEEQRTLSRIALDAIGCKGYALAGSGAIREHGLTHRPTEDIDLFSTIEYLDTFSEDAETLIKGIEAAGYNVSVYRRSEHFMSLVAERNGIAQQIDMGIDYREHQPQTLEIGPVLDIEDAVANKVCAVFSRGEVRDYIDLDSIRRSGRFTDSQLIEFAKEADPGFTTDFFVQALADVVAIRDSDAARYGVDSKTLQAMKSRILELALELKPDALSPEAIRFLSRATAKKITAKNEQEENPKSRL